MTTKAIPLSRFYAGWGSYQRMLSQMLAPLHEEQLALPAGPHRWTVGMVAQHVVANRVWWFRNWMGEGAGDAALAAIAHWDPADPVEVAPRTAPELVAGLVATWELVHAALDRWTAADLDQTFTPPATLTAAERATFRPVSRQWIIWHVLEHEIHHGGELSLSLGSHGLPGIYGGI